MNDEIALANVVFVQTSNKLQCFIHRIARLTWAKSLAKSIHKTYSKHINSSYSRLPFWSLHVCYGHIAFFISYSLTLWLFLFFSLSVFRIWFHPCISPLFLLFVLFIQMQITTEWTMWILHLSRCKCHLKWNNICSLHLFRLPLQCFQCTITLNTGWFHFHCKIIKFIRIIGFCSNVFAFVRLFDDSNFAIQSRKLIVNAQAQCSLFRRVYEEHNAVHFFLLLT